MLALDNAGPLERAWRVCGYRIMPNAYWSEPEVIEWPGTLTVVVIPERWAASPKLRDFACGFAISELFRQRYDVLMLIRGILAWPCLVEQMGARDREEAAD
jgi:hypothetical protein